MAEQFVTFYYQTFDGNRAGLAPLYRDHSMLTFETSAVQGVAGIIEKLTVSTSGTSRMVIEFLLRSAALVSAGGLPFQKVQHKVATLDAQPSGEHGGILVLVTGALLVDEEQNPMNYTQTFQLMPDGAGSYFVFNDVFRLIYNA
ncbi:nuclear transport factor 2 family protein [Aspergillus mulundensis]|uniref:NTF2-related export protein n=1 Tax=Aspergillus mulundensis TaxID=1810919 RepID=A0A3D8SJN4_9EURO|nr:Nuclear transport factor 2 [Aspergillus mulundensis]RDW86381.1 Nuclear transport factor 2 [Aspergillus mulundensis]